MCLLRGRPLAAGLLQALRGGLRPGARLLGVNPGGLRARLRVLGRLLRRLELAPGMPLVGASGREPLPPLRLGPPLSRRAPLGLGAPLGSVVRRLAALPAARGGLAALSRRLARRSRRPSPSLGSLRGSRASPPVALPALPSLGAVRSRPRAGGAAAVIPPNPPIAARSRTNRPARSSSPVSSSRAAAWSVSLIFSRSAGVGRSPASAASSAASPASPATSSRSFAAALWNALRSPPASNSSCAALSSSPAASSRSTPLARRRASWFSAHAATVGLRSALTASASSRLPSLRSAFARSSRARVNSPGGRA